MTATSINLFDFIPVSEHAAIAAQTNAHPCDTDLASAIAALPAAGGKIEFGSGKFSFSDTINLKKTVTLEGVGSGEAGATSTVLSFAPDKHGIVINRSFTLGDQLVSPPTGAADASIVRNLALISQGGTTGHGVWMRARSEVSNCTITNFKGNGINIVAENGSADPAMPGNANNWLVSRVRIAACHHGLYVQGDDANAGTALAVSTSNNAGWGIWDYSFLGNTYIGCLAEANALGPYKTSNATACNVFVGCYSEEGQPPSSLVKPTIVISGQHGAGFVGDATVIGATYITPISTLQYVDKQPTDGTKRSIETRVGGAAGSFMDWAVSGDHPHGWGWVWHEGVKVIQLKYGRADAFTPIQMTTSLTPSSWRNEANVSLGYGQLCMEGAWVYLGYEQFRWVGFKALDEQVKNLLARVTALEAA